MGPVDEDHYRGWRAHARIERKRLTGKPYVMKERVTTLEPEERLEYDLLSGLPVRNYHAVVTLADAGKGTDITWSARFDPPWPIFKGLWRGGMLKVVNHVAERLALGRSPIMKAEGRSPRAEPDHEGRRPVS
jgi:Polyketide cyclase / dehydrase and lipid transport